MSFKLQLEKFAEKAGAKAEEAVRKVAMKVYANVVTMSPVDTGRFRGNWNISMGKFDRSTYSQGYDHKLDKSEAAQQLQRVLDKGQMIIGDYKGGSIYISNNLPYAMRLEDGYSDQAPVGMVRITLAMANDIVKDVVKSV